VTCCEQTHRSHTQVTQAHTHANHAPPPPYIGEGLISLSAYQLYRMLDTDLSPMAQGGNGAASGGGGGDNSAAASARQSLDTLVPDDAIPERKWSRARQ
jgi:hypothetical protein